MGSAEPRRGPLVRPSVHRAAVAWLLGSLQFVAAMIAVQLSWPASRPYSLKNNYISDLGNTACGYFPKGSPAYVCSPWHTVFNVSVVILGLLVILGAVLVRTAFPPKRSPRVALVLVALAGFGAIGVGLWPENVNGLVHSVASGIAFIGGGLGLLGLTLGMLRDTRWDGYRLYTLLSGVVTLAATALFERNVTLGIGIGGVERLVVAPLLLWLVVVSLHLLRIPSLKDRPPDAAPA
jgi:hypothetical membrane protein